MHEKLQFLELICNIGYGKNNNHGRYLTDKYTYYKYIRHMKKGLRANESINRSIFFSNLQYILTFIRSMNLLH